MTSPIQNSQASDGEPVAAKDMAEALTAAEFVFGDGATQSFAAGGSTTYVEGGRPTHGEWAVVEDGRFSSFWPPSYRATYDLRWRVEDGEVAGLVFVDPHGVRFAGRYHWPQ